MQDHTGPGGYQTQLPELYAEKGADDPDTPHSDDVKYERNDGFSRALQHSLDHYGYAVDGFRYRYHAKYQRAQQDHLSVSGEQADHCGGEDKQQRSGADHEDHFNQNDHGGKIPHTLPVPGAQCVSRQGGGRGLHSIARDVESGFHRVGDGMSRGGHVTQGVDHSGKSHIAERGPEALEHIGQCHFQTGLEHFPVWLQAVAPRGDDRMLPQSNGDENAAQRERNGACYGSAHNAPARAGQRQGQGEQGNRSGGVNEQEVENNVDHVDQNARPHRRFGVANRPQDGSEDQGGGPGEHGGIEDKEILGGQLTDRFIHLHPDGDHSAERKGQRGEENAAHQNGQHRLRRSAGGGSSVIGTKGLGDIGQKTHTKRGDTAVDQPVDGGGGIDGSGGLGAKGANHGGINILHCRLHQLLQHGGPGKGEDDGQQAPLEFSLFLKFHRTPHEM